jgi:RNA polymerase sigma-70 factor (ECF subfamily)
LKNKVTNSNSKFHESKILFKPFLISLVKVTCKPNILQDEKVFIAELLHPKTQNEAFRKLLQLYQKPLYHHIRGIVLNHDDTDDVLQNTFLKVHSNLHKFKGDCKLFSWMYRIATNESLTFIQQRAKKQGISNEEVKEKAIQKLESDLYFDGDEIQLKLQRAVACLPKKQQLVFKMKYFEALKYEEISEILTTSVGALKASYHLAVKKIEHFLKTD